MELLNLNENKSKLTNLDLSNLNLDEAAALEAAKLTALKKKINANSWNNHLEDLMKSWGEKAAGNREMHDKSAGIWKSFSNRLYLPIILLTTLGGVTSFGTVNSDDYQYWMYGTGAINLLAALLSGIHKYYSPDERVQNHKNSARAFGSFYRYMTLELGMPREDRSSSEELSKWARNEYDNMLKDSPSLSGSVVGDYKNKHKDDKNKPDIIEERFSIHIHGREYSNEIMKLN
jgi:hypothetical protein